MFALAAALYLPVLRHGFVWDDIGFIVENPAAHSVSSLRESLAHGYGWVPSQAEAPDASLYFRPSVTLANTVQWVAFDGQPWAFHLKNVMAHAGAAAALTLLALWLGLSVGAAILAGAVFAAHPVLSEAVAWISGRTDGFAGLFGIVALLFVVGWRQGRLDRLPLRGTPWIAALALFLALASKESAAALLVLFPAAMLLPLRGSSRDARPRPFAWTAPVAAVLAYVVARIAVLGAGGFGGSSPLADRGPIAERMVLGGHLVVTYLQRIVFPHPLATEPPPGLVGGSPSVLVGALGMILFGVGLGAWVWAITRELRGGGAREGASPRRAAAILGAGLFLFALTPVLQFVPTGEIYGERFLYLPLAGALLALAGLFDRGVRARPAVSVAVGLALLIPLSIALERRLPDWKDEATFFASQVRTYPDNARANANYGTALVKEGRLADAEPFLKRAASLDPSDGWKRAQYGSLLVNTGRFEEGVRELEAAYAADPRSRSLLKNYGIGLMRTGRHDEAARVLEEARALDPLDATVLEALGMAERRRERTAEATAHLRSSIELDPSRESAWLNLIGLHVERGEIEAARDWAARFTRRFPNSPETRRLAAWIEAPASTER